MEFPLNHCFLVIDSEAYAALKESRFLREEFAAVEERTTIAGPAMSWSGFYLYGTSTYFEFFDVNDSVFTSDRPIGLAFGGDEAGGVLEGCRRIEAALHSKVATELRVRNTDGVDLPWFHTTPMRFDGPVIPLYAWVMEYHRDFLTHWHPEVSRGESGISRRAVLDRYRSFVAGTGATRLLGDLVGMRLGLSREESRRFALLLEALGYSVRPTPAGWAARGPDIELRVEPEEERRSEVRELTFRLDRAPGKPSMHHFGASTSLEVRSDATARWTFVGGGPSV